MAKFYGKKNIFRPKKKTTLREDLKGRPIWVLFLREPTADEISASSTGQKLPAARERKPRGNGEWVRKTMGKNMGKMAESWKKWETLDGKFGNKMGKICTNHW